jgi:hypothetical protein
MTFRARPTEVDIDFLASLMDDDLPPAERRRRLASDGGYLQAALDHPEALARLDERESGPTISPWLLFALYLRQAARDLEALPPIPDWTGPREVVPVLDAPLARSALRDPRLRAALEGLLTAFTRLRPQHLAVRDERGRVRHLRLSDLDPNSLRRGLEYATGEVAGDLLRRMADAHLFLAGVHPEHVVDRRGREIGQWEQEGQGLYRAAAVQYEATAPAWSAELEAMAASFHGARRALNFMRERHLARAWPAWFEHAERGA